MPIIIDENGRREVSQEYIDNLKALSDNNSSFNEQLATVIRELILNKANSLDYSDLNEVSLCDIDGGYWQQEARDFKLMQSKIWTEYYYFINNGGMSVEDFIERIKTTYL